MTWRVAALLCGFASALAAQELPTAGWDSTTKTWTAELRQGTVTRWVSPDGALSRVAVRLTGDHAEWALDFYFRNDSLLHAFDRAADGVENRYTFAEGTLVRWLARMAPDAPEFEQDPEDAAYYDAAIRIPELARCWVRFHMVSDANWDRWGEETGCGVL
ncbi:MAG: hypothetical protein WD934_04550 [Gemmatimonadales bacterium]